jgi:bacillithiol system protein YtxJ
MANFIPIEDKDALDRFLTETNGSPAVIMKHSNTCGISSRAYREMSDFAGPVGLVTVQDARSVSDDIERITGVPHETPQVLILRENKVLFMASHFDVKAAKIASELERLRQP